MVDPRIKYLANKVRNSVFEWPKYHINKDVDHETGLGLCSTASYCLWQVFKANNIKSKLIVGECLEGIFAHSWLDYNNYTIDLTCRQFGPEYPKVLIRPSHKCKYLKEFPVRAENEFALDIISEWEGGQNYKIYYDNINRLVLDLTAN